VNINGFLSQGYLQSNGNNFLADTKSGTAEFNEMGLTITANPTDKLRLGTQFLSRDMGKVGNNEVIVDWAFADYHAWDFLGFRAGKIKMPIGLYNQGRDSDMLRTMIFLPQSIYDEGKRDLLEAFSGGSIYGNIPLGKAGDLEYQAFYGEVQFYSDSLLVSAFKGNAQKVISDPDNFATFGKAAKVASLDIENKYMTGGAVVYNPPVSGLRLGGSFMQGKTKFSSSSSSLMIMPGADTISGTADDFPISVAVNSTIPNGEQILKGWTVLSLEYIRGPFTIAGEYMELERRQKMFDIQTVDSTAQGYYGTVSYTFFDRLTLSALYDVYYEDMSDKKGEGYVSYPGVKTLVSPTNAYNDGDAFTSYGYAYQAWRKDMGAGLRFDVNDHWTLKAEYHEINGTALNMGLVNPPTLAGTGYAPELRKNWNYIAFKSSFNF
jgi:hypothetical protein